MFLSLTLSALLIDLTRYASENLRVSQSYAFHLTRRPLQGHEHHIFCLPTHLHPCLAPLRLGHLSLSSHAVVSMTLYYLCILAHCQHLSPQGF